MSRMHISHLSGTGKSGDNLTALGAQRISALQKAMKNLSHFCNCTKKGVCLLTHSPHWKIIRSVI